MATTRSATRDWPPDNIWVFLPDTQNVYYRGTPEIEKELVYVVQTDGGQDTLTPAEFGVKYGWRNDPERVRQSGK